MLRPCSGTINTNETHVKTIVQNPLPASKAKVTLVTVHGNSALAFLDDLRLETAVAVPGNLWIDRFFICTPSTATFLKLPASRPGGSRSG